MSSNNKSAFSRRALLRGSSILGGGLFAALNLQRPLALAAMESNMAAVFTPGQWQTVAAITGRIVPTDHQPGAVEADCVNFIDKALANEDAESRPDFIAGLTATQMLCIKRLGKAFAELDFAAQDSLLNELATDTATPWPGTGPAASVFFDLVRVLTIMGFMADPKYGGNANMAGWRVAHYPGPRHHQGGYTPAQMLGEEEIITVWVGKM
jgi:gluconate 2-dehydrogenase gamma chain